MSYFKVHYNWQNCRKANEFVKPSNVFEPPKSLFEERMQNQANQLRKTSQPASFPVYENDEKQAASSIESSAPMDAGLLRRRLSTDSEFWYSVMDRDKQWFIPAFKKAVLILFLTSLLLFLIAEHYL